MRIRVESPFTIRAGLYQPVHTRRVAAVGHNVHWYDVPSREIDAFLRSIYHHYQYGYSNDIHSAVRYQWYASLTLYYRGATIVLDLSYSRLYHNPGYRLQFRRDLSSEFGFYPVSVEFWEFDNDTQVYHCSDVREILKVMVKGVTK
jgi:hypothetical protein